MDKKRGRPRKFNKKAFLNEMRAGLSRNQVCEKLKISYGALEYHLRLDKYFRGKIYAAERKTRDEKRRQEINKLDADFEKKHGYTLSHLERSLKRVSDGEISEEDALRDSLLQTFRHRNILIKKRVPFLSVSNIDGDVNLMTWGEFKRASTIEYREIERLNFDAYLIDLARRNPRKWGPAAHVIREWYKYHPEMQRFFECVFIADPATFRWILNGPPSLPEVEIYLARKEVEFEEYKQEEESHERARESLRMCDLAAINKEIHNRIRVKWAQEAGINLRP